jgi:hypothetical protein
MDFSKTYKTDSPDNRISKFRKREKNENAQLRENTPHHKLQETRKTSSSMHQRTLHHKHAVSVIVNRSSSCNSSACIAYFRIPNTG